MDERPGVDESVDGAGVSRIAHSRLMRGLWFVLGWVAVAVGGLGVVVPGLPTTGFMVLAAACFSRSSPRFERWVLGLPGVGRAVADYRAGHGMPGRAKVVALSMMTIAVALSTIVFIDDAAFRVVVVVAGLVGAWFIIWRIPTAAPRAAEIGEP